MASNPFEPLGTPRRDVGDHDHAVCVYRSPRELRDELCSFLGNAHRDGALAVFVHSHDTAERAERLARGAHHKAPELDAAGRLRVVHHRDAFQGDGGRIDHDHVAGVVASLLADAEALDAAGVSLFVDASHTYIAQGRDDEWFDFEAWLGPRLERRVGLVCAYRHGDLNDPTRLDRVLTTHAYRYGEEVVS